MHKEINCSNFIGLMGYLQKHYGDDGIQQVINGLVDNEKYLVSDKENPSKLITIQKHHLQDSAYWVSNEFSLALFANANKFLGGSNSLIKAGEEAAVRHFTKSSFFATRIFSTQFVCKQATRLNARFNRTKEVKLSKLTDNSSIFELHYHPNFRVTKDICNWNLGIYKGIATVTGVADVKCEEIKCVVDGDPHCVFHMRWRKKPNLFKRLLRWILKIISKDLVADYEVTVKERDRLIDSLSRSEERYRALTDQSLTGIFIHNNGRLMYVNDCMAHMLDYSPEEMVGKDLWAFVHPEDKNMVKERELARYYGVDTKKNYEFRALKKGGEPIWLEILATTINYADQSTCMGNIIDLTSKRQTEEALRESEEKYRTVLETSTDPIIVYDIEGKVTYFNPAFTRVFGWTLEERLGKKMDIFVPESDWVETRKMIEKVLAGESFSGFETRRHTKEGKIIHVNMSASIYKDQDGNPIGSVINLRDITEQKRLEAQLRQAQKMEAMGTLAGGIAHDFNNLLMGIQGRTSLMLMGSDSTRSYYEHLKGIEDYVKSAADLTKQLLGFAMGGKYEVKTTDLNVLIKNQNRMFGRTRKEINIQEKFEENLWTVEVDQGQIEQMLLNIYVNAWQAMPGGGDLYIQTQNTIIDDNYSKPYHVEPGRYVKTSITDTGIGMDETIRQRIFDPFFTTKEMERGTGLGLASAYGIIKNHKGFINVYSEKGEGTTFNIYFPASEKKAIKEQIINEELVRGTETVLLVDDEDMIIEIAQEIIENLGYKVWVKKSGKDAVKIYEKNQDKIDMVILDMIMPEMGGGETYDHLKKINPEIKVLLSSGYSINGQAAEILQRGCDGFIQKPFNLIELSKKIREILDKD